MTTLMQASGQWSSRPADQRFSSLETLAENVAKVRARAHESHNVPYKALRVEAAGDDIKLIGPANVPASLTHWSFGQLAGRVGAPANYLRTLSPTLSAQNLNYKLARIEDHIGDDLDDRAAKLLLDVNGSFTVRALTGEGYSRIWNADIVSRLQALVDQNPQWQPAPAAFDGSRGLYASDHDLFCFMVDNERRIFEKAPGGGLARGFFVANSEEGDKAFWMLTFFYEFVCGNHRVWGASGIRELNIRHVGSADDRAFEQLTVELKRYAESSASEDEAKIQAAMNFKIADTKEAVLDAVFGLRIGSRKMLLAGINKADEHADWYGSPLTAWGLAGGLTEIARDVVHADQRVVAERAAGRVMQMAF